MVHVSGNSTWVDYPSTATLISATRLENIEGALDRSVSSAKKYRTASTSALSIGFTSIAMTGTQWSRGTQVDTTPTDGLKAVSAGMYQIGAVATFLGGGFTVGFRDIVINDNGTTIQEGGAYGGTIRQMLSFEYPLAVNDVITMQVYTDTTCSLQCNGTVDVWLTLTYLGP